MSWPASNSCNGVYCTGFRKMSRNQLWCTSWVSDFLWKLGHMIQDIFQLWKVYEYVVHEKREWEDIPTSKKKIQEKFKDWVVQFSSVAQSCLTLCDSIGCSVPGFPVHHQLPEFTQTHVLWVNDAIHTSHPLSSPSPPAFNLSQHQGLFQWVSSSHQVAKVLAFQPQHQSFQWIFRTDFL